MRGLSALRGTNDWLDRMAMDVRALRAKSMDDNLSISE